MIEKNGYVLPFVIGILVILGFSVVGVMELSQTSEKKALNDQLRVWVEEVARDELQKQSAFLEETNGLETRGNRSLTPIIYPTGCTSSDRKEICQKVTLTDLGDLSRPSDLPAGKGTFKGWRFRLDSEAENIATGSRAILSLELSYAKLTLVEIRDLPSIPADKDEDYIYISQEYGYEIPEWWKLELIGPISTVCIYSDGAMNIRGYVNRTNEAGARQSEWRTGEMPNGFNESFTTNAGDRNITVYVGTCGLRGFSRTCKFDQSGWLTVERGKTTCVRATGNVFNASLGYCPSSWCSGSNSFGL